VKFDHLGVVVRDLAAGRVLLGNSIGVTGWGREYEEPLQDVYLQFGRCASGICYEIVAPRSAASPISRVLASKVNVLNHVAYLVGDLGREAERLEAAEFVPVGPAKPGFVFGNRSIQFFVSPSRFLLELIEAPDHQHEFGSLADRAAEALIRRAAIATMSRQRHRYE
jgi:methylmalonyl-CoA/ethylmalonyl-CoA epimerase